MKVEEVRAPSRPPRKHGIPTCAGLTDCGRGSVSPAGNLRPLHTGLGVVLENQICLPGPDSGCQEIPQRAVNCQLLAAEAPQHGSCKGPLFPVCGCRSVYAPAPCWSCASRPQLLPRDEVRAFPLSPGSLFGLSFPSVLQTVLG